MNVSLEINADPHPLQAAGMAMSSTKMLRWHTWHSVGAFINPQLLLGDSTLPRPESCLDTLQISSIPVSRASPERMSLIEDH